MTCILRAPCHLFCGEWSWLLTGTQDKREAGGPVRRLCNPEGGGDIIRQGNSSAGGESKGLWQCPWRRGG